LIFRSLITLLLQGKHIQVLSKKGLFEEKTNFSFEIFNIFSYIDVLNFILLSISQLVENLS
jgi:hypothetical protein